MAQLPSCLVSHTRRVCRLYKQGLRTLNDWYHDRVDYRYQAVLLREEFDKNAKIPYSVEAYKLLLAGEARLESMTHYLPYKFARSVVGIAHNRELSHSDAYLDTWHPMEKACYPKFFARREKLKKEYMEEFFKMYPEQKKFEQEPH